MNAAGPKNYREDLASIRPYRPSMVDASKGQSGSAGDEDPEEWDLPPKPKAMRWPTYERWVSKYDAAEEMLDAQLVMAAARLMKRF